MIRCTRRILSHVMMTCQINIRSFGERFDSVSEIVAIQYTDIPAYPLCSRSPVSKADSCTSDSRLMLKFQACPDVLNTESTGKMTFQTFHHARASVRATHRLTQAHHYPPHNPLTKPPVSPTTEWKLICDSHPRVCVLYTHIARLPLLLAASRRFESMLTGHVTDLLKQTVS